MKRDLDSQEKAKQFKLLGLYNVQKGFINRSNRTNSQIVFQNEKVIPLYSEKKFITNHGSIQDSKEPLLSDQLKEIVKTRDRNVSMQIMNTYTPGVKNKSN